MQLGKPVLVTTAYRGVFFGYLKKDEGDTVILQQARNCVSWSASLRGFLGLAVTGPSEHCRIGPAVEEIKLRGITSVTKCTDTARLAWEKEPWS